MSFVLDDFVDNVIPGILFNELSVGNTYVMLERTDVNPHTIIFRELIYNNGTMLDTHCGYKFDSINTIIDEIAKKSTLRYFYEISFLDDSNIFYGKHTLVADKIKIGNKKPITELPYLNDHEFLLNFKKIIWVRPTFPELFDELYNTTTDSMFTEIDVLNDPTIVTGVKLSKKEQLQVTNWNSATLYYLDDPCEEVLISMCKTDLSTLKDYIGNYITYITDNVKRELANYDFKFLIDRYHILPKDLLFKAMDKNLEYLLYLDIPKDIALELVKENPNSALYINMLDDELKLEAIKKQPKLLKHFKNVTVDMLMVASGEDPVMFKQCNETRPDIAMKLLEINGDFIKYCTPENQTEELCITAVRNDPEAIKHISKDKLTEKVLITAVQTSPNIITQIDNPSENVCIEAVKQLPGLLKDIKNQTEKICIIAVNKAPLAIRFVNNQTYEMCLNSIQNDPSAIKYIHNLTPELIFMAIYKDPKLMCEIDNRHLNLQICLSCAYLDPNSIEHIKDDNLRFDCATEFMQMITTHGN